MLNAEVLVVVVTRNNPALLENFINSITRYNANYEYKLLIIDHKSDNPEQKKLLDKLSKSYIVSERENNRVEASFNSAWQENKNHKHYLFLHDDTAVNRDDWLRVYVERLNNGHVEEVIKYHDYAKLPIGKVGSQSQLWRTYSSILGYPIQCLFLKDIVKEIRDTVPEMFKYTDCDRVFITNECLKATNGIRSVQDFKDLELTSPDLFSKLCDILNSYLQYNDEGIPPRELYPSGKCWNKFCLTAELLNSVDPLIKGYRTISLEGDGFLENIHGYDELWGHKYLHHFGASNFKQAIAKHLNTDAKEVSKMYNNKAFLIKCNRIVEQYFKEKT